MVAAGEFREDLWFRINTFEIVLPPLRERIDDILPLARHLVPQGRRHQADDDLFSPEAIEALRQHDWPGNVRELANVVEHALILCDQGADPTGTPARRLSMRPAAESAARHSRPGPRGDSVPAAKPPKANLRQHELQAILDALDRHGGNKPKAAEELGISLKTLYNKLNQAAALDKTA